MSITRGKSQHLFRSLYLTLKYHGPVDKTNGLIPLVSYKPVFSVYKEQIFWQEHYFLPVSQKQLFLEE